MNLALSGLVSDDGLDNEDKIDAMMVEHLHEQAIAKPYGLPSQEHKAIVYDFDPRQKTRMVAEEQTTYRKKKE